MHKMKATDLIWERNHLLQTFDQDFSAGSQIDEDDYPLISSRLYLHYQHMVVLLRTKHETYLQVVIGNLVNNVSSLGKKLESMSV